MSSYYRTIPEYIASDDFLSWEEKGFYSLISALCKKRGYAWSTNKFLSQEFHRSLSTIHRYLCKLQTRGYIYIEVENGNERKIWMDDAWRNKDKIERVFGQEPEIEDEELNQEFYTHVTDDMGGVSRMTRPIEYIDINNKKEEVVSSKGESPKPRPSASAIPPLFHRDLPKEHISPEGLVKLLASYDREVVEKKVTNAETVIGRLAKGGKFDSEFYQLGADALALRYCEEAKRRNDASKEKSIAKRKPAKGKNFEETVEERRSRAKNYPLLSRYAKIDDQGLVILEEKVGSAIWNQMTYTGVKFENEEFDFIFDLITNELEAWLRHKNRL